MNKQDHNLSPEELEQRLKEKKWETVQIKVSASSPNTSTIHLHPLSWPFAPICHSLLFYYFIHFQLGGGFRKARHFCVWRVVVVTPFSTHLRGAFAFCSTRWGRVQGLSAWINSYLNRANIEPISVLPDDVTDGVRLLQFLELVSGRSVGPFKKDPTNRIQKIENCSKTIKFIKDDLQIKLVGIGAEGT